MTFSSDSSSLYTFTVQSGPPLLMQHFPLHPRLQTSYPLSAHFVSSPSAPSPPPLAPALPSPLTPSGFFNGMLAVSEPRALNCYTFFRFIPLALFVSRNPTLIHIPFFGFLDYQFCDLIAPTPGLAFSLLMPHTLAVAS